jgi:hypothetical protein
MAPIATKGNVQPPAHPIPDVIDFRYTGDRLHPTQKPVHALKPHIAAFCPPGGTVLEPLYRPVDVLTDAAPLAGRGCEYRAVRQELARPV